MFKILDTDKSNTLTRYEMEEVFGDSDATYFFEQMSGGIAGNGPESDVTLKDWQDFFVWSRQQGVGEKRLKEAEERSVHLSAASTSWH